jgi:hypothetical protein
VKLDMYQFMQEPIYSATPGATSYKDKLKDIKSTKLERALHVGSDLLYLNAKAAAADKDYKAMHKLIVKNESNSVRLVVLGDDNQYYYMSYVAYLLERCLYSVPGLYNYWGNNKKNSFWSLAMEQLKIGRFANVMDYGGWDESVNNEMIKICIDVIIKFIMNFEDKLGLSDEEIEFIRNSKDLSYLKIDDTHTVKMTNGLPSGWRWTTLINSICNVVVNMIAYAIENYDYLHLLAVLGDDVFSIHDDFETAKMHQTIIAEMGFELNKKKSYVSNRKGDFLKMNIKGDNIYGEAVRTLRSLMFSTEDEINLQGDSKRMNRVDLWLKTLSRIIHNDELMNQTKMSVEEYLLYVEEFVLDDLVGAYRGRLSRRKLYYWLHTPQSVGGAGLFPHLTGMPFIKMVNKYKEVKSVKNAVRSTLESVNWRWFSDDHYKHFRAPYASIALDSQARTLTSKETVNVESVLVPTSMIDHVTDESGEVTYPHTNYTYKDIQFKKGYGLSTLGNWLRKGFRYTDLDDSTSLFSKVLKESDKNRLKRMRNNCSVHLLDEVIKGDYLKGMTRNVQLLRGEVVGSIYWQQVFTNLAVKGLGTNITNVKNLMALYVSAEEHAYDSTFLNHGTEIRRDFNYWSYKWVASSRYSSVERKKHTHNLNRKQARAQRMLSYADENTKQLKMGIYPHANACSRNDVRRDPTETALRTGGRRKVKPQRGRAGELGVGEPNVNKRPRSMKVGVGSIGGKSRMIKNERPVCNDAVTKEVVHYIKCSEHGCKQRNCGLVWRGVRATVGSEPFLRGSKVRSGPTTSSGFHDRRQKSPIGLASAGCGVDTDGSKRASSRGPERSVI